MPAPFVTAPATSWTYDASAPSQKSARIRCLGCRWVVAQLERAGEGQGRPLNRHNKYLPAPLTGLGRQTSLINIIASLRREHYTGKKKWVRHNFGKRNIIIETTQLTYFNFPGNLITVITWKLLVEFMLVSWAFSRKGAGRGRDNSTSHRPAWGGRRGWRSGRHSNVQALIDRLALCCRGLE